MPQQTTGPGALEASTKARTRSPSSPSQNLGASPRSSTPIRLRSGTNPGDAPASLEAFGTGLSPLRSRLGSMDSIQAEGGAFTIVTPDYSISDKPRINELDVGGITRTKIGIAEAPGGHMHSLGTDNAVASPARRSSSPCLHVDEKQPPEQGLRIFGESKPRRSSIDTSVCSSLDVLPDEGGVRQHPGEEWRATPLSNARSSGEIFRSGQLSAKNKSAWVSEAKLAWTSSKKPAKDFADVLSVSPKELAKQIALMNAQQFRSIKLCEFSSLGWTGPEKNIRAANIVAMTQLFNQVAIWTGNVILFSENAKRRLHLLCHFIAVAKSLYDVGDFNGVYNIISALNSTPIYRLQRTWTMISRKERAIFDKLSELMSPLNNCESYRQKLAQAKSPCIPYLGLFLSDLTYLNEALKKERALPGRDRQIREREDQMAAIIKDIERYQIQAVYDYEVSEQFIEAMETVKFQPDQQQFQENRQYQRSYEIEPKMKVGQASEPVKIQLKDESAPGTLSKLHKALSIDTMVSRPDDSSATESPTPTASTPLPGNSFSLLRSQIAAAAAAKAKQRLTDKLSHGSSSSEGEAMSNWRRLRVQIAAAAALKGKQRSNSNFGEGDAAKFGLHRKAKSTTTGSPEFLSPSIKSPSALPFYDSDDDDSDNDDDENDDDGNDDSDPDDDDRKGWISRFKPSRENSVQSHRKEPSASKFTKLTLQVFPQKDTPLTVAPVVGLFSESGSCTELLSGLVNVKYISTAGGHRPDHKKWKKFWVVLRASTLSLYSVQKKNNLSSKVLGKMRGDRGDRGDKVDRTDPCLDLNNQNLDHENRKTPSAFGILREKSGKSSTQSQEGLQRERTVGTVSPTTPQQYCLSADNLSASEGRPPAVSSGLSKGRRDAQSSEQLGHIPRKRSQNEGAERLAVGSVRSTEVDEGGASFFGSYYRVQSNKIKDVIEITEIHVEVATDYLKRRHVMRITTEKGSCVMMQAQSQEEMQKWINSIHGVAEWKRFTSQPQTTKQASQRE
ncbi:uncharacterized protein BJ171DRAFT_41707 [Polychytrium aggregatum]|uniref:uncharacterized protein n=1 Tax=Polychytrium aggregatum TaxID=110093 RepID=UPI0022FE9A1E|nr:uncharacterized protein BJ171DRAFT_41707 [Polychytrium aggregatum]KAI9206128.1 hypothetical protein BJ171DRAFT_41707 [Polychytrium aggregatum]